MQVSAVSGSRLRIFSLNAFLEFRQYKILKDNGRISHRQALEKAYGEYEMFNKTQPIESDFDRAVKKMIEEEGV